LWETVVPPWYTVVAFHAVAQSAADAEVIGMVTTIAPAIAIAASDAMMARFIDTVSTSSVRHAPHKSKTGPACARTTTRTSRPGPRHHQG
jgi:hypothetical protein